MKFSVQTRGNYDFVNLTDIVTRHARESGVADGMVLIFVKGSTAALTVMEYEDGLMEDTREAFEKIARTRAHYRHHLKWGDYNGAGHIKSIILKPDLLGPVEKGQPDLGLYQQIVLIDFDIRPRRREIVLKFFKADKS